MCDGPAAPRSQRPNHRTGRSTGDTDSREHGIPRNYTSSATGPSAGVSPAAPDLLALFFAAHGVMYEAFAHGDAGDDTLLAESKVLSRACPGLVRS
ncbi:hypothetical protein [Streptomyces chartreusis]|uniref:hypothetical protein n=1 Tax=Streptomyces chartreusis TaxID=1969 RepID=UPI003625003F